MKRTDIDLSSDHDDTSNSDSEVAGNTRRHQTLKAPKHTRLVRPVDNVFVKCLKKEMLANPTTDVAPLIGLVCLGDDDSFDTKHPESYMYETLGGNNSRTALVELLKENPALKDDKRFSHRIVSVYSNLTDEDAQLLAVKHNRQQSFVHSMTTQDKVCSLCTHLVLNSSTCTYVT